MEERKIRQAEAVVAKTVKPRFPLTTLDEAVRLIVDLTQADCDPHLAVIGIVFNLVHQAVRPGVRGKRPRDSSFTKIPWQQFEEPWREFVKFLRSETITVATTSSPPALTGTTFAPPGTMFAPPGTAASPAGTALAMLISAVSDGSVKLHPSKRTVSLADFKLLAVMVAQFSVLDNVSLSLTERLAFVRIHDGQCCEDTEKDFIAVPGEENELIPVKCFPVSGSSIRPENFWICSKKQFVECDAFMAVAEICCRLEGEEYRVAGDPLDVFQAGVLGHLYRNGHLKKFPAALAVFGSSLSSLARDSEPTEPTEPPEPTEPSEPTEPTEPSEPSEPTEPTERSEHSEHSELSEPSERAEDVLLEAVRVSLTDFENAYVTPSFLLFEHFAKQKNRMPAFLAAVLASDVVRQYHYIGSLDKRLNHELLKMATILEEIIAAESKSEQLSDPTVVGLLLTFIDNICLWEERSSAPIWHSTWSQKLISSSLCKLASKPINQPMQYGGTKPINQTLQYGGTKSINQTLQNVLLYRDTKPINQSMQYGGTKSINQPMQYGGNKSINQTLQNALLYGGKNGLEAVLSPVDVLSYVFDTLDCLKNPVILEEDTKNTQSQSHFSEKNNNNFYNNNNNNNFNKNNGNKKNSNFNNFNETNNFDNFNNTSNDSNFNNTSNDSNFNGNNCNNFFPENFVLTEEFCRFALGIYEKWPPLRLDFYSSFDTFLHKERSAQLGVTSVNRSQKTENIKTESEKKIENKKMENEKIKSEHFFEDIKMESKKMENKKLESEHFLIELLKTWPVCPSVSDADFERMSVIRPANPLYEIYSKHVFPFLDMGPPDVPIFCFDTEKIKREIKIPHPKMLESRIIFKLQQILSFFEAGNLKKQSFFESDFNFPVQKTVYFSHVLLKSQKMLSVRGLLGHEKFNQKEICLKLEGSATGEVGSANEKRSRRPSSKACLK